MADESLLPVARIAVGEFVMGAEDGEDDERPAHRTYVDEFHSAQRRTSETTAPEGRDQHPVTLVCYEDAAASCALRHGRQRLAVRVGRYAAKYLRAPDFSSSGAG